MHLFWISAPQIQYAADIVCYKNHIVQWRIQDLPGGDCGERVEREPKRRSGGGAPSGVKRQSPWWRVRGL